MNGHAAATPSGDPDHPSPHRGHTSLAALWTGLLLAPAAWFAQLCIATPLLSQACYPRDEPLQGALPRLSLLVLAVDGATLLACAIGLGIAWLAWRRTSGEKPGHGGRLLASGDGRTRFMAMAGLLASSLVATAVLYTAMLHLLLRECGL